MNVKEIQGPDNAEIILSGQRMLNFSGFCYLGLNGNSQINAKIKEALDVYGFCNDLSYGISNPIISQLERDAASFRGSESSIYFATGYLIYPIAVESVQHLVSCVFMPDGTHYSAQFAASSFRLKTFHFPKDYGAAELMDYIERQKIPHCRPLILSDGVCPTTGVIRPIDAYLEVASRLSGYVICDDAHGFGTVGMHGRGVISPRASSNERLIYGATFSKAFSLQGGMIFGSAALISKIRNRSKFYNGTTLPLSAIAAGIIEALKIVKGDPSHFDRLRHNSERLKQGLADLNLSTDNSSSPIASINLGSETRNKSLVDFLFLKKIISIHSYYSGAPREGCVRLSVYATHKPEHVDRLITNIQKFLREA